VVRPATHSLVRQAGACRGAADRAAGQGACLFSPALSASAGPAPAALGSDSPGIAPALGGVEAAPGDAIGGWAAITYTVAGT